MSPQSSLNGTRALIAGVLQDWATLQQAADALGKPPGAISGVLGRMHRDGLLEAESDPQPPTRGTRYRFVPDADSARGRGGPPIGALESGVRFIRVDHRNHVLKAAKVLDGPLAAGLVRWAAFTDAGWLLGLVRAPDAFDVQKLCSALEGAGCEWAETRIDDVVSAPRFYSRMADLEREQGS